MFWKCWFHKLNSTFCLFFSFRCTDGYMGSRCEYKDLDGSYLREYNIRFREWHCFFFSIRNLTNFSLFFFHLLLLLYSDTSSGYAANSEHSEWCVFSAISGVSVMSSLLCAVESTTETRSMQWCAWREWIWYRWRFAYGTNSVARTEAIRTASSTVHTNVTSLQQ